MSKINLVEEAVSVLGSKGEVAKVLGISKRAVYQYIKGERKVPASVNEVLAEKVEGMYSLYIELPFIK